MRQLSEIKSTVSVWRDLEQRAEAIYDLIYVAIDEEEFSIEDEFVAETEKLEAEVEQHELVLAFAGQYVKNSAILAIHAGAGGTESQDWVEMLMRMYLRWSERKGYETEILKMSPGDEAGIKSVMLDITGDWAYGYLKAERGVHRLIRLSPFDTDHGRHTSFALVEVLPEVENDVDVNINLDDLKIDVFKSSGPGGQNVQKNSTAIRVTHMPTGIVVTCQDERSQYRNKEIALKILRAQLVDRELEKQAQEHAQLKGEHITAGWGNQIRSYVLHPYKMVKDHRTAYETSNPDAVLDGDIDELLMAYLKSDHNE